jgi:heme A synthase
MPEARPATRAFSIYAWTVLIYHVTVVILWGAYVRASGSGAGCGEHWPLCNGTAIPHSPTIATLIEFSHRVTSGIALGLALGLLVFAFLRFPARHLVRRAAMAAVFFELMEALIGAALVLLGQTARDTSTGRGYTLSIHLINTLMLVGALTVAAWAAGRGRTFVRPGMRGFRYAFGAAFAAMLILGVSGAIAALGDTLFRVNSVAAGFSQDVAAGAHPFLRLRIWHPAIAAVFAVGVAMLCYAVITRRISPQATRNAYVLAGLLCVQVMVGMMNLALLAPIPLQLVHLLLADLVWIGLILMGAEVLLQIEGKWDERVGVRLREPLSDEARMVR